jgi:oxygen-dependent protoporphyrinogen oxidase
MMEAQKTYDAMVVGGGISGLTTAFFLQKRGYRVAVLEKDERTGGAIRTEHREGFLIEHGPNSTLETTPVLRELFAALGILDEQVYANDAAKNRYIVRGGVPRALPMSPLAFLKTPLFSLSSKLRLLKEPFIAPAPPDAEETLAEFVQRRLGQEFLDYAINPFVAGVYAGKPERLSVRSAFPKLYNLEQKYGSLIKGSIKGAKERRNRAETAKVKARLFSFRSGLQTLPDALHKALGAQVFNGSVLEQIELHADGYGVTFRQGNTHRSVRARTLILALPAHAYPQLPLPVPEVVQTALHRISYPPVAMVYFGYKQAPESIPLDGFGMLVPEKEQKSILGTIWSSTIFPQRAPAGGLALTTFVGGSRQPELALLPERPLAELVQKDLRSLMHIRRPPDLLVIKRWEKAIPQYETGHDRIIAAVTDWEAAQPGLFVTGNFRGGISVSDCIKHAHELSEKIDGFIKQNAAKAEVAM